MCLSMQHSKASHDFSSLELHNQNTVQYFIFSSYWGDEGDNYREYILYFPGFLISY